MSDEHPTEHRTGHEHEPALNKLFRAAVKTKATMVSSANPIMQKPARMMTCIIAGRMRYIILSLMDTTLNEGTKILKQAVLAEDP